MRLPHISLMLTTTTMLLEVSVCVCAEVAAAVAQKNNHYVWQIIMMRVSMYPMINESKINAAIE